MFQNPVDIANRALQHCGAQRIDPTLGFTENSVNASECAFAYDKLRSAELQRNYWKFATKFVVLRAIQSDPTALPTMLLVPTLYSSLTSYSYGALVTDSLGNIWESQQPQNLGYAPGNSPYWELYYGPLAVPAYDTSGATAYYAGDIVYTTAGDGTYRVFRSLTGSNEDVPGTVPAFDATVYYKRDQVASYSSTNYQSLIDFNFNQVPSATTAPALWDAATTYTTGDRVRASNGYMYTSVGAGNLNNNPVFTSPASWTATGVLAAWTSTLTVTASAAKWLDLGATLAEIRIINPVGVDRSTQRNIFRLPANYLRTAPQSPKAGSVSILGAPTGLGYSDWNYEGQFITSASDDVIVLRFIADITNVFEFDEMFCEGLALRLAYEIAPRVTQSAGKQGEIAKAYQKFMGDARVINAIETGAIEPPEDDFIQCRF